MYMTTKKDISNKTKEAAVKHPKTGVFVPVCNLNRYIRGERVPSLQVARMLSQIIRCKKDIWLDRSCVAQRQEAIRRYGEKNNSVVQFHRGRPKIKHNNREHCGTSRNLRTVQCCGNVDLVKP